jgi:hypothetical protein
VRTYGQYCPIARVSEFLAERWTMIILRNILVGCQTFNEIADGAPGLSRGLLSKRLRELEGAGIMLWVWANFFLDRDRLPRRRVVVRFEYPSLPGSARRSWLLIERGDAEYCLKHPGGEEELIVVVNDPLAFARWHIGQIQWRDALRAGAIEVQGSPALARALPRWNRHGWAVDDPRAAYDGSTQHRPTSTLAATTT